MRANRTTDKQLKIELLSQWKLEAESCNTFANILIYGSSGREVRRYIGCKLNCQNLANAKSNQTFEKF